MKVGSTCILPVCFDFFFYFFNDLMYMIELDFELFNVGECIQAIHWNQSSPPKWR